mgnify:CR=1 FL=1
MLLLAPQATSSTGSACWGWVVQTLLLLPQQLLPLLARLGHCEACLLLPQGWQAWVLAAHPLTPLGEWLLGYLGTLVCASPCLQEHAWQRIQSTVRLCEFEVRLACREPGCGTICSFAARGVPLQLHVLQLR